MKGRLHDNEIMNEGMQRWGWGVGLLWSFPLVFEKAFAGSHSSVGYYHGSYVHSRSLHCTTFTQFIHTRQKGI